jgi:hypothetical protein
MCSPTRAGTASTCCTASTTSPRGGGSTAGREQPVITGLEGVERPVAAARTWLLAQGWRRHGLIALPE